MPSKLSLKVRPYRARLQAPAKLHPSLLRSEGHLEGPGHVSDPRNPLLEDQLWYKKENSQKRDCSRDAATPGTPPASLAAV